MSSCKDNNNNNTESFIVKGICFTDREIPTDVQVSINNQCISIINQPEKNFQLIHEVKCDDHLSIFETKRSNIHLFVTSKEIDSKEICNISFPFPLCLKIYTKPLLFLLYNYDSGYLPLTKKTWLLMREKWKGEKKSILKTWYNFIKKKEEFVIPFKIDESIEDNEKNEESEDDETSSVTSQSINDIEQNSYIEDEEEEEEEDENNLFDDESENEFNDIDEDNDERFFMSYMNSGNYDENEKPDIEENEDLENEQDENISDLEDDDNEMEPEDDDDD